MNRRQLLRSLLCSVAMVAIAVAAAGAALSFPASRTIAEAVSDRLTRRLGPPGDLIAPLLLSQLPLQLGISPQQLRPVDRMAALRAPVLIASGTADQHTTLAETRRIYQAAGEPKQLWEVEGAAHVDLHRYAPKAYEAIVLAFLNKHLRGQG